MSLYNMLHGVNPLSGLLLEMLKIDRKRDDAPKPPMDKNGEWEALSPYDDDYDEEKVEEYVKECVLHGCWRSGRFRDIYLNGDGTRIILYTRNGGGNREGYYYIFSMLRQHPNYISDYDDDFDSTYAYIEFSVPREYLEVTKTLADGKEPETIAEKFHKTMKEMEGLTPNQLRSDARFRPVCTILDQITEALEKKNANDK